MSWDPAWTADMPHTVTVEAPATYNGYGEVATWGASVTFTARVAKRIEKVRSFTGEETVSKVVAWLKGTPNVGARHRVTLPAGFLDSTTPPVLAVEQIVDEGGVIGEKLYFG